MKINSFAVSITVEDVQASSYFLTRHFGFIEKIAADGFASLTHETSGTNILYMQKGITVLPEFMRFKANAGTILAFVTTDLEKEEQRLKKEGVPIAVPIKTEDWGEKIFIVQDPNGVVIEVVEWVQQH